MVHRPSKPWSWLWRVIPYGRQALDDLDQTDQMIEEVRDARLQECARYPEIVRQANKLERAAVENGFTKQLTQGFHPRTT